VSEPVTTVDGQGQPVTASAPMESGPSAPPFQDRPEIPVAGAFAGGLVLALILKRLAR
jgi:hypothetical protein